MQPYDLVQRDRKQALGIRFAQIVLGDERQAGEVWHAADLVRRNTRRGQPLAVQGHAVVGQPHGLAQSLDLQRRQLLGWQMIAARTIRTPGLARAIHGCSSPRWSRRETSFPIVAFPALLSPRDQERLRSLASGIPQTSFLCRPGVVV